MVAEGCLIPSQPSTKVNFHLTTVGNHPRQPTAAQQFDYLCTLLVRFGDKSRNELGRHGLQLIKSISTMHDIRMKAHSEFIGKSSATASTPTGNYNQPTETFAESTQSTTAAVSAAAATHQPMSTVRYTTNKGSSRRGIAPTGAANPDATIILWTDKPTAQIAESTEMATVIAVVKANRTQTRSSNPSHPTKPAVAADCGADNFRRLPTGSLLTAALYIQRDVAGEVQELPQWICECQSSQTPVKPDASQARCQLSRMPDEPDANEARCQSSQMPVKPDASRTKTPLCQTPLSQTPLSQTPLRQIPLSQTPLSQTSLCQTPLCQNATYSSTTVGAMVAHAIVTQTITARSITGRLMAICVMAARTATDCSSMRNCSISNRGGNCHATDH